MQSTKNYVGIDISKLHFDAAIELSGKYVHYKLSNDATGFNTLMELLPDDCMLVMEASGPYYLKLACFFHDRQISVSVINPLVIRRFCQMRLSRTKTDKKDAKMIAEYGKAEHPSEWHPEAIHTQELRQMQATTDLLDKHRTSLLRHLEAASQMPVVNKQVLKTLNKTIKSIEHQIAELELTMDILIKQYHGELYEQIQSIPGLGKKTSLLLIVISGGFTKFADARQLSSYIGLCPRIFESGTSVRGKARITKMGMSRIRGMLYLCAWSARRYNHKCKDLYDRLVAKGKSKKLALIAVANKRLKQAFAIAKQKTCYQQDYAKNICF